MDFSTGWWQTIARTIISGFGRRLGFDALHVAKSAAWLNARIVWSTILTFVVSVALANLITPDEYGRYKFIIAAVTFWGTLFLTGANVAVSGAVARGKERTFLDSIRLQLKWDIAGAICIAATGLYYIWNSNISVGIPILVAAVVYPIATTLNTYSALYAGRQDFKSQSLYESLTVTIYFVLILAGLLLGAKAGLLAILFFASNALGHGIGFRRARRTIAADAEPDAQSITYAKQLSVVSIPTGFMLQLDNILVFHYLGSAELAIYTYAMLGPDKISSLLKFIPSIALPRFARRSMEQLQSGVIARSLQFSLFAGILALFYIVAAPFAFRFLFPQYLTAVPFTRWYALSLLAAGGTLPLISLFAQQRIRRIAALQIGLPLVQLIITFLGVTLYGLWGAIIAKLAGDFLAFTTTVLIHQYSANRNS